MAPTSVAVAPAAVTLTVDRIEDFRLMLREQIVDDNERLRDIEAGLDGSPRAPVQARLDFLWSLARQVGGLY